MAKPFRDLPTPVKQLLAEQLNTTFRMHEATGLSVLECRKIVLDAGGHQELLDCIANLPPEAIGGY